MSTFGGGVFIGKCLKLHEVIFTWKRHAASRHIIRYTCTGSVCVESFKAYAFALSFVVDIIGYLCT